MVKNESRSRRLFAVGILLAGALIVGLGVGVAYGVEHWIAPPPAASADAPAMNSEGVLVDARLRVAVPGVMIERDLQLDPAAAKAVPAPGASVHREVGGLGVNAPVDASLDLNLASGSHVTRASDDSGTTQTQGGLIQTFTPKPEAAVLAAAAFAGVGILTYFWASVKTWGYRLLIAPLMPLYAHISRADVFENDVRERIFGNIRDEPGVSASELGRKANVSWGTTMYHLDVLEQTRMVTSVRDGRYRRYFVNGATGSKETISVLRNEVTARVVENIRAQPGSTQKDLAAEANMTPQALHWHLTRLVGAGLVEKQRDGRLVRHFAK